MVLMQGEQLKEAWQEDPENISFPSFASSTTAHGFSRLVDAKHHIRKLIWCTLLVVATISVILVLAIRYVLLRNYSDTDTFYFLWPPWCLIICERS